MEGGDGANGDTGVRSLARSLGGGDGKCIGENGKSACVHLSAILEDKREKMEVNWGGNGIRAAPLIGACKINVLWTLQLHKIGTC